MSRPRKLTDAQVKLVRDNYRRRQETLSNAQMAAYLKISENVICNICRGTGYKTAGMKP